MTVFSTRFLRLFAFVMGVALFSLSLFVQPIFAQSTTIRAAATTATAQVLWTSLQGHTVYQLSTAATRNNGLLQLGVFAVTNKGLFRSLDSGRTWNTMNAANDDTYDVLPLNADATSLLIIGDKGIQRTVNNGATWQTIPFSVTIATSASVGNSTTPTFRLVTQQRIFPAFSLQTLRSGNTTFIFAGTSQGVFRSTDNGMTWSSAGTVSAAQLSTKTVRTLVALGSILFAAVPNEGIFRSQDNGATWSVVDIVPGNAEKTFRVLSVYGSTIYAGSSEGNLYQSTNGTTWTKLVAAGSNGRSGIDARGIEAFYQFGSVIVGASYNGLVASNDNGRTWQRLNIPVSDVASLVVIGGTSSVQRISVLSSVAQSTNGNADANIGANARTISRDSTIMQPPTILTASRTANNVAAFSMQTMSFSTASYFANHFFSFDYDPSVTTNPNFVPVSQKTITLGSATTSYNLFSSFWIDATRFVSGGGNPRALPIEVAYNFGSFVPVNSGFTYIAALSTYNAIDGITRGFEVYSSSISLSQLPSWYQGPGTYNFRQKYRVDPGQTFEAISTGNAVLTLTILPPPAPTITSISPATFLRGSNTTPATVLGTNFELGSKVFLYHPNLPGGKFELTTTFVNANTLQTAWSYGIFSYIGAASSVEVGVENPAGGVTPVRQILSIVNPAPGAGGLNPVQINAGATSPLGISGTGYFEGSQVFFNGQLKPSTFSNGSLTIQLLPSDIPVAGTYSVVVTNPAPGGGSTQPMTLNVLNPQPYIYSFSPTILGQGQDVTVTLSGSGTFMSGTTVRFYPNDVPLSSTFVNTNTITVTIPGALLPTASETAYTLRAFNPAPGGGASNTVTLTVRNAAPTLTGISPNTLIAASQDVALTLTGSNFLAGAQVLLSGSVPLAATVVNGSTITATLPAQYANAVGTYSIIVRNPNAVGDSQAQMLSVVYPQPQLAPLTPSAVQTGSGAMTLTLTGSNFISGAEVLWNGSPVSPSNQTASSMTLGLSAAQLANSGVHTVQVRNPQPNLGESATLFFAVRTPAPTLTAISPTLLLTNLAAPPTITLTGTGFVAESRVIIRSLTTNQDVLTLQPTLTSGTQASFPFPLALISTTAQYAVRVENPALPNNVPPGSPFGGQGGGTTAALTVSTQNPLPTLTGLTPSSLLAGANATTFTLTGTNFLPALRVLVGGQPVPATQATILSETTLELTLPAAALASAATLSVQVSLPAPGGGTSATRTISLTNPLPVLDAVQPSTIPAFQEAVIQALGSGFTPQSQFRLVRGTTTVTLAIVSLPSSTEAFLRISSTAIVTLATYQVRVLNSAPGGGTSVSRNLVVQPGAPVLTEFVGVSTTAVVAGGTLPAFTVRLRDALGNLTDVTTASLTLPIQFSNRTSLLGVSSGTLVLTRSSLGVYTTTATRFSLADSYHFFANNFSSISGLSTTGTRTFTVIPAADSRVTISGVPASTDAGDVLPTFSLRFEDAFGNLTDNGIGRLTYTRAGGSSTATLAMTRVSTGIYTAQSTVCTIAGTYNLAVVGITAANTLGTKSFVIVSGAAVSASVSGLTYSLNAGSLQSAFDVRFSDVYGNFTDRNVPTSVQFTNSTNAVNGVSTGTVALVARIGIGLYDAARVTLTTAGNYAITHASMTMLGNRLFMVNPLAVTKIVVDVPNNMAITLGDVNAAITVIYKDRFNNGSEPVSFPATLQYTGLNVASTGTLELVRTTTATGVLAGTAKARPSALTMIGDYRIDLPAAGFPIAGIQTIRVIGREPDRAEISGLPESLCGASGDIDVTVRFFDALGMPTNYYPTSVRYALFRGGVEVQQGMLEYVAEIAPGVLRYRLRAPFAPGEYRLRIPSPTIVPEDVTGTVVMEVCSPPAALSVVGANISPGVSGSTSCIVAGQSLTGLRVNVLDAFGLNTFGVAALSAQYQGITCVSSGTLTLVSTATRGVFLEAAPPTIFTTAGTYRLTVSTNGSFSATTLGTFCVEPDVAIYSSIATIPQQESAGVTLSTIVVRYFDRFGNLTDNGIQPLLASTTAQITAFTSQRLQRGIYRISSALETSGTYTLGTGLIPVISPLALQNRRLIINASTATRTHIRNLANETLSGAENCTILHRQTQSLFEVQFFDRFGNLTELMPTAAGTYPPPATYFRVPDYDTESSSGTITLTGTGIRGTAIAVAPAQQFLRSGSYILGVRGIQTTTAVCSVESPGVRFTVRAPGLGMVAVKLADLTNNFPEGFGNVPIGTATIATIKVSTYDFPVTTATQSVSFSVPYNDNAATLISFTGEPGTFAITASTTLTVTAMQPNSEFRLYLRIVPKGRGALTPSVEATAQTGYAAVGYGTIPQTKTFFGTAIRAMFTTNTTTLDFGTGFSQGNPLVKPLVVSVQNFTTSTMRIEPPTGFEVSLMEGGTYSGTVLNVDLSQMGNMSSTGGLAPSTTGHYTVWVRYAPASGAASGLLRLSDGREPNVTRGGVSLTGASSGFTLSTTKLAFGADEMTTLAKPAFRDDKQYTINHTGAAGITVRPSLHFTIEGVAGATLQTDAMTTPPTYTIIPSTANGSITVTMRYTTTASAAPLTDRHTSLSNIVHTQGTETQTLQAIGTRLPSTCATCTPAQNVTFQNDRFRVNGADFFPIGWYGGAEQIRTGNNIPAGNVLQPYWNEIFDQFFIQSNVNGVRRGPLTPYEFIAATRNFLNSMLAHNKHGIINIPTLDKYASSFQFMENATGDNIDNWAKVIAADEGIRNHSAMLGWYTADEPENEATDMSIYATDAYKHSLINFRSLSKLYSTIRNLDLLHPVFVVVANEQLFRRLFVPGAPECIGCNDGTQYFDVLMQDDYVIYPCFSSPSPRLAAIPEKASLLRDGFTDVNGISQSRGSTIFVTQGFGDRFDAAETDNWKIYGGKSRIPTFDEMRYSILSDAFAVQDIVGHPTKARHSLGGVLYFEYSLTALNPGARTNSARTVAFIDGPVATILGQQRATTAVLNTSNLQPVLSPQGEGTINPIFREDNNYYYLILINSAKDGAPINMQCSTIVPELSSTVPVVVDEYRSRKNFVEATIMPSLTSQRTITQIEQLTTSATGSVSWVALPTTAYSSAPMSGQITTTISAAPYTYFRPAEVKVFRLEKSSSLVAGFDNKSVMTLSAAPNSITDNDDTNRPKEELLSAQKESEILYNLKCTPNPAHEEAAISFSLLRDETVSITLADVLGREVMRLKESEVMSSGHHVIPFNVQILPTGMYQCRIFTKHGVYSIFISHYQ